MSSLEALAGIAGVVALGTPGWLTARAARVPAPLLGGLLFSLVALVAIVLVLDAAAVPIGRLSLGAAWSLLTLGAGLLWWRTRSAASPVEARPASPWRGHLPLLLPLLPALAVVIYRACAQPLSGVDTVFRWNYLAEQMLARGTLAFYPPVTAEDYAVYSWPDGIAPTVAAAYAWLYALAGETRPALTAPFVVLQFCLLAIAVHAVARRQFSDRAAAFAVALAAASPLLLWAVAMGQETGLTALALTALLLYLPTAPAAATGGAMVFAGVAAALGALAREYGLVLPLFGLVLCLVRRLPGRATVVFSLVALAGAAPWYLRNALHTGNPLFNLSVAGIFPVNEVHAWLNASYLEGLGWSRLPDGAWPTLLANAGISLLALAAGAWLLPRRSPALLAGALIFIALWAASVGYTAAGFTYALRVLSPALAVAAVLGGGVLARWIPVRPGLAAATVALSILAGDAALRALTLPVNAYRLPPASWLTVGGALHEYHARPLYRELARTAGSERLLVLGPNALLTAQGARTLPLWSPEVRYLFDPKLGPAEIARRLRADGVGFVLLTQGEVNARFLARSAFFRDPAGTLVPAWSDADHVLLRVHSPAP